MKGYSALIISRESANLLENSVKFRKLSEEHQNEDFDEDVAFYENYDAEDCQFEDLEKFLVKKKVSFKRFSAGGRDFLPEIRLFIAEENFDETVVTDTGGDPVVYLSEMSNISSSEFMAFMMKKVSIYEKVQTYLPYCFQM